jgi:hypothetical protein
LEGLGAVFAGCPRSGIAEERIGLLKPARPSAFRKRRRDRELK